MHCAKHTRILAVLLAAVLTSTAVAEQFPAITLPFHDVTMKFTKPGRIVEVPVKESERIKKGQLLAKLDDSEEQIVLTQDKARAEDNTKVEAQNAIREHEKAKLAKIQYGFDRSVASQFELQEAKLAVLVEEAKVKLSKFEHDMEKLKAQQSEVILNKMSLVSPVEGRVEKQFAKLGESVEPNVNVVRIIDLSKLNVETPVPFEQAVKLKEGDTGVVTFSDNSKAEGKITFIAGVADPGSGTLQVRVELQNDWKRPAGDRVKVEFPAIGGVAGK